VSRDELWAVPDAWSWVTFRDVAEVRSDLRDPSATPDAVHIAPNHIESRTGRLLGRGTVAGDGVTSPKHAFHPGQVLYSKIRPYLAKAALVDFEGLCSADMYPVTALPDRMEPRFLHKWLISPSFTEEASRSQGRTVLPKINQDALHTKPVPLPPLLEQKRIANKLDALLARVDACRERLDRVPAILKRLRQAVVAAATSGELTREWRDERGLDLNNWESTTVGALLEEKPRNGYSPRAVERPSAVKSLTLTATTGGVFRGEHFKYIDQSIPPNSHLWLVPGDILIQRANTIEYVGVSAIFDGPTGTFIYPDLMMKCRANARILVRYLHCVLSSEPVRKFFRANATGTAGNMPKINQQTVLAAPAHLPPLDEQREIVRRLENLLPFADRLSRQCDAARQRLETLTPSMLGKAFRGELVPQDPNDEPAGALLARVRGVPEHSNGRKVRNLQASRHTP
jgi:type I restriction enzyme, S subunit